MKRQMIFPLLLLTLLLCSACGGGQSGSANDTKGNVAPSSQVNAPASSAPAQSPQVVSVSAEEAKLAAGGTGEAVVRLDIVDGYHVHANPATDKFYIATELKAAPQEGISPGKPVYPQALTRKLEFADAPLALYEGKPVIKLPLTADKSAAKGRHAFRATVRVQACNDEACLPPRNIETTIPVTIE